MATAGEYILVVVNGSIIVVTVVGGLLTLFTLWTRPVLRKLVNVPLASLSCADILFATLVTPFWIQQILYPQWEPPAALCWLVGYASPVLWGVSVSHMLCIALHRYFMICTNSARLKSTRVLVIMLLLTWLVPIVSFLPLYVGEEVKVDPKLKRCAMGRSDKLWAKIPPVVLNFFISYIAAIILYSLIQNHVRKSEARVRANAPGPSTRLAVQISQGGPSTSTATASGVTKPLRNLQSLVWMGEDNSSSSDEEQDGNDTIETGRPKGTILVASYSAPVCVTALDAGKQHQHADQGRNLLPNGEKGGNEPGESKRITLTVTIESDQVGTNARQRHAVPGSSSQNHSTSAAERQITKMMMTLLAVYTLCCMPMTIMVIFSGKVPSEAFTVGQLLAALNGALNPIVYGAMNKNIRRGYKYVWDSMLNSIT
ncbi:GPR84 [Branchiostoma lanceolatum]|uniref:GPR84 protein n=1 Tax=Branchiostoma lanceolatum TaxID=7740 RepID=A0A8J9ZT94_BRALA|nr:GPR84 [Branchiostoma lanceolatum]